MKFLFPFFLFFTLLSCQKVVQKEQVNLPFLPNEANFILKINDAEKVKSLLKNNSLLQQNKNNPLYQFFSNLNLLQIIKSNNSNHFYLCFSPLGKNDFGYTVVAQSNETPLPTDKYKEYFTSDKTYGNYTYKEFNIDGQLMYVIKFNNTWVLTSNYLLMENHIKQFENSIPYKYPKAFESLSDQPISMVMANTEIDDTCDRLFPNLLSTHLLHKKFTGWTAGDFFIDKNTLDFNAIYKPNSNQDFSTLFKGITPQNNDLAQVTPINAKQFTSYTFDSYSTLIKNLVNYNHVEIDHKDALSDFLNETSELGLIQLLKHQLLVCKIPNESIEISTYFDFEDAPVKYRDFEIFKLNQPIDFSKKLDPLVQENELQFFIRYKEFIIFSESVAGFKELIPSLKSENTLSNQEWYLKFSDQLTQQSSLLTVVNVNYGVESLKNSLPIGVQKKWEKTATKNYKAIAFQIVSEDDFSHLHVITSKSKMSQKDFKVSETENVILANTIKTTPQFVTNYISKTKDIVVQDEKDQLIVINNKGEIKWKKQINEPILGAIKQMDIYRNGRLQYVFTTPTKLYVIDRTGKNVAPYPIHHKQIITQPVALFDYDNNRKYRIIITQGTKLVMYDNKGRVVKGFHFKNKNKGIITHAPKHIRVGKKDFIVVNEANGGVHFLSRTGKERIKPKQPLEEVEQEWFWYKNAFTALDINNSITQVSTAGEVTKLPSKLTIPGAKTVATSKTWVSFAENSLSIKDKVIELEYGNYTSPKIFYLNNKIYITITNIDSKKVYLFDSNAVSITGFPVFGTSEADISNADKDNNLELIVKGDDNSVLFYDFR